ncbi:helicase associated domain-containing protein [Streptomyces sp. NPDC058657]|uniref:helicase associated domain-containing protein n=1 Tax=unclassified Streptomyces TaxID=2593676 RepID=UPI00365E3E67
MSGSPARGRGAVREERRAEGPLRPRHPGEWTPGGFPLGTWLKKQRNPYRAGDLTSERAELEDLGMVRAHQGHAFEEGLTAARRWAAKHGHFLPPATAV